MPFPPPPPPGDTRRAWGLGDALAGGVVGFLAAVLLASVVESALQAHTHGAAHGVLPAGNGRLAVTVADLLGLWAGLAGSAIMASRAKGTGSLAADFGLSIRWRDLPVGIALGLGGQLLLVPLLYLPWEALDPTVRTRLSRPAEQLAGGYHGVELAVVGALVVVGAPVVEELYFRGLLLRSLVNRLGPALGEGAGQAAAVVADALLFALAHYEPLQLLGLAVFGVVLAVAARFSGRIGVSIVAHASFNAVTVVALATR